MRPCLTSAYIVGHFRHIPSQWHVSLPNATGSGLTRSRPETGEHRTSNRESRRRYAGLHGSPGRIPGRSPVSPEDRASSSPGRPSQTVVTETWRLRVSEHPGSKAGRQTGRDPPPMYVQRVPHPPVSRKSANLKRGPLGYRYPPVSFRPEVIGRIAVLPASLGL